MAKKIKKITLDGLAVTMQAGFNKVDKDIESLAQMTARGFENTAKDIGGVKADVADLKSDVQILQTDVSDIKLRLDNLAPKFEVRDLEKRVERLEEKAGIRHAV
jgi:uncharacterized protein YoxC